MILFLMLNRGNQNLLGKDYRNETKYKTHAYTLNMLHEIKGSVSLHKNVEDRSKVLHLMPTALTCSTRFVKVFQRYLFDNKANLQLECI